MTDTSTEAQTAPILGYGGRVFLSTALGILAVFVAFVTWISWPYFVGWFGVLGAGVLGVAALQINPNATGADMSSPTPPPIPLPRSPESERFWFWSILVGGVLGIALLHGFEDNAIVGFGSLVVISTGVIMLRQLANVSTLSYIKDNLGRFALIAVAYIGIGLFYSGIRLGVHAHDWRQDFDAIKARYEEKAADILQQGDVTMPAWIDSSEYRYAIATMPEYENSKGRIVRWAAFWPWSGAHFLLSDLVARVLDWIVDQFSGVYDWIALKYTHDLK